MRIIDIVVYIIIQLIEWNYFQHVYLVTTKNETCNDFCITF
jgi:hypothetical protein